MFKLSKKAQIGETIPWVVALPLLLFFVLLFLLGVVIIARIPGKLNPNEIVLKGSDKISDENLKSFVDMPIIYNNEKITVKELLIMWTNADANEKINYEIELEKHFEEFIKSTAGDGEARLYGSYQLDGKSLYNPVEFLITFDNGKTKRVKENEKEDIKNDYVFEIKNQKSQQIYIPAVSEWKNQGIRVYFYVEPEK